jgi:DNA repair exonuclease SbcCD ATPase subunit
MSAASSLILWGITCAIAFDNPVEKFLNKILAEAKQQTTTETQTVENKSELLDLMYETMESDNETLSQIKDLIFNVRADVREIEPLKENIEKLRTEMTSLKKELRKLQENKFPNPCPTCGKPLMPEFKNCPYCGDHVKPLSEQPITVEAYR